MTPSRDDVIRMAREAGAGAMLNLRTFDEQRWTGLLPLEVLERFAALVAESAAAAEREACAAMALEYATWGGSNFCRWFEKLAAAIRARSTKA